MCLYVCVSVCAAQRAIRHPLVSRTVPSETHAVAPAAVAPAAAAAAVADDDANRKIDWHDYAQIARDEQRTGTVAIYHSYHHHHCHDIERGHSSHPSSTNRARRRLTLLIEANALPYAN